MNSDTAASVFVMIVAAIGMMLLIIWISTPAGAVCLSKQQARQLWPKQHIYWYSKNHCWSNRRGPPRNLRLDPVIEKTRAEQTRTKTIDKRGVMHVDPKELNEIDMLAPNSSGPIIMFPELNDPIESLTRWWNNRWQFQ